MNYFIKHILSFFFIGIITIIIFILYLGTTNYSGGEIGMIPFLIAIYLLTVIGITSVLILFLKILGIDISILKSSALFSIIYLVFLIFYFDSNPFNTNKYLGDLNFWLFLSEVSSFLILNSIIIILRKNK